MTRARDVANLIGSGNYSSTTFTATAGQTAFTISHTQGFVQVFMNGLLLDETVDYTSNGTAITLTSGAAAGDEIEVVAYNTFSVGDAQTQTQADARYYTQAQADARYELDGAETRFLGVDGQTVTTSNNVFTDIRQGPSATGYAEMHIGNDLNERIIIGTIGSGYTANADWTNSTYIYNTANRDMRIKSSLDFEIFSGGTSYSNHLSFTADTNGRITTPRNPAFNVRGQASNTYSTSWQKLVYNDSLTERGGSNYSTANSRFTAPVAGWYQFNAQWSCTNNSDADGTFTFWINGGVPANTGSVSMPDTGGSYDGHVLSCTIPLSANDYVEVYRYSTASSTSRGNSWQGNFSGYLIG